MKKTLIVSALLTASVALSSAVTTATVRNFTSPTAGLPILDNTGTPIRGSYAVGFYASDFDFIGSTGEQVRDGLTQFGSELNSFVFDGLIGAPNSTSANIPKEGGSPFTGNDVFVLFGDASTLADSTLFGVVRLATQFQNENDADLGVVDGTITGDTATVEFGFLVTPSAQPTGPVAFNFAEGLQLSAVGIPEPSTSLLAALAGLGLVARRRR
jgi:hypothetical protein